MKNSIFLCLIKTNKQKMIRIIVAIAAVCTFGFANAQDTKFGVKAGGDFTSPKIMINDPDTGFYVGGFVDVAISKKLHIQPEVLYVSVKNLSLVQVPVLARFPIVEDFSLLAGPDFGYILNAGTDIKSFNFGLDFGASFDVSDDFFMDAKYNMGLTDLLKTNDSGSSFKLRGIFFGLGYKF